MIFSPALQWFDRLIVGLLLGLFVGLFWLHHIQSLAVTFSIFY
jgi:hypothetical protein